MKALVLGIIALALGECGLAQDNPEIRIKAGHSMREYFSFSQRFRYDQFQDGKIYYENGRTSQVHKFNYDLVEGKMFVIQSPGDTLPMVPIGDQKIKLYKIGNDVFLYLPKDKIVEVLNGGDSIVLGVNTKYEVRRTEMVAGGNGYSSGYDPTGSAATRGSRSGTPARDVILRKSDTYYIIGSDNKAYPVSRSKIIKSFPSHRQLVTDFIDSKKIDFKSRNDLEKLVAFLNSLNKRT